MNRDFETWWFTYYPDDVDDKSAAYAAWTAAYARGYLDGREDGYAAGREDADAW